MTPWLSFSFQERISAAQPPASAGACMGNAPSGQQVNDLGTAGVIARPPLLFLAALLLGLAADHLLPLRVAVPQSDRVRWVIAGCLIVLGLALFAAGIRNFSRARTPV